MLTLSLACSTNAPISNIASNQNAAVPNRPADTGPAAFEGYHDITDCNIIAGWAWDKNHPNETIKVDLYDGEKLLTSLAADEFREDLLKDGKGDGKHGFDLVVPPSLRDSKPHTIRAKFGGTSIDLGNTPKLFNCVSVH